MFELWHYGSIISDSWIGYHPSPYTLNLIPYTTIY